MTRRQNLVGRNVVKTLNFSLEGGAAENLGANDIGFDKNVRIKQRSVNVSFGGEVNDDIDVYHSFSNGFGVTDIALMKLTFKPRRFSLCPA